MTDDLPARLHRLARKLEDPDTCEWLKLDKTDTQAEWYTHRSKLGFWGSIGAGEESRSLLFEDPHWGAAGWLIECLINAEAYVEVDTPNGTITVGLLEHLDGVASKPNLLESIVEAAEQTLGIEG